MTRNETNSVDSSPPAGMLQADSLGASIVLVVVLVGLQRLIGLVRNIGFCSLLGDEALGRWSLTYNFLLLAAPVVVLGIPGSFGRYVEHYRQRGQLRTFLRRTSLASLLAAFIAFGLLMARPQLVAVVLYADAGQWRSVPVLSVVLVAVIGFNFLAELLTALRLVRVAAVMQLVCSIGFAVFGVGLMFLTTWSEHAATAAYGLASVVASLWGAWVVVRLYHVLPRQEPPLGQSALWSKLVPLAGWIWTGNLIANLFAVCDQFMLKHFSGLTPEAADSLVGQYYSSRVVPVLLIGVASLLASSLLPYLIEDWEAGRLKTAMRRINTSLKLTAVSFTAGGALVLIASPLLFHTVLRGKYDAGLSVLPATMVYCVWSSMFTVAYDYLLCVEKARLGSLALVTGLLVSIVLNYCLAPRWGLSGVVFSTVLANGIVLAAVMVLSQRAGMVWDTGVWCAGALPLTLCLGGWPALSILLVVFLAAWPARWVFEAGEASGILRQTIVSRAGGVQHVETG